MFTSPTCVHTYTCSHSDSEGSSVNQLQEKDNKHKHRVHVMPVKLAPFESQCVLASCHSLSMLDGELVGDPLEKVALNAIDWNLSKGQNKNNKKFCDTQSPLIV